MAPRLRVCAGPSVDKLKIVCVNDEDRPTRIESENFEGKIAVRISHYTGVRPTGDKDDDDDHNNGTNVEDQSKSSEAVSGLDTGYFDKGHAKGCTWSIQVQGRFKKDVCVDDVEYGNQFEHSIRDRLPWGTSVALRAINILDPSLRHDVYCDQPWAFGPLITSMTRINVKRLAGKEENDQGSSNSHHDWPLFPTGKDEKDYVHDDTSVLLCDSTAGNVMLQSKLEEQGLADRQSLSQLRDAQNGHTNRARFWSNQAVRQAVNFCANDIVTMTFDNGIIDFNTLRAVLPYTGGMGFDLQQFWDGQPVRYFCKDSRTNKVFFVIEFQIIEKDGE